jgi:hypothetical protein
MNAPFPKLLLLFAAVDWPLYMRRPMVYALAESAAALGCNVVAVNRPLCPVTTLARKPRRLRELFGPAGLDKLADNLYLYSPRYVIHDKIAERIPLLENFNLAALRYGLKRLQSRLQISEPAPIIWFHYPQQGYVMKLFPDSFCIYEIYDNLADNNGRESESLNRLEKQMRPRADLLLTTSDMIQSKYASNYRRSCMWGNGLTRQAYNDAASDDISPIPEILAIPSPRIGYSGMISERLDWNLITGLAALEPNWNFIFAGKVAQPELKIYEQQYHNIHFVGEFDRSVIPSVMCSFDIGLLPYLDNPFFHFLNPLKFYEYAAAGLPSVSSPIEELKKFPHDFVRILPNNPHAWQSALEDILASDRTHNREIGRKIAAEYIWEDMTAILLARIRDEWLPAQSRPTH